MPRDENSMEICSTYQKSCVEASIDELLTTVMNLSGNFADCNCLASCTNIDYDYLNTASKIDSAQHLKIPNAIKGTSQS